MLNLLSNKVFVTQLIGLALAIAAMLGIPFVTSFDQETAVATVMATIAAVTIVLRYLHGGTPEADGKRWWQSRTIWVQIVAAGFAILALFRVAPPLDQEGVLSTIMMITTVLGAIFGAKAKASIG